MSIQSLSADPSKPAHINNVPEELWINIFSFLPAQDFKAASLTCRKFSSITQNDFLWQKLLMRDFHIQTSMHVKKEYQYQKFLQHLQTTHYTLKTLPLPESCREAMITSKQQCVTIFYGHGQDVDQSILIYDLKHGHQFTLKGHEKSIFSLSLSEDEQRLFSGSYDGTIKVWDLLSKTCLATLQGHQQNVNCLKVLSETHLISGSFDGTLRIWNLDTLTCENELDAPKICALESQNGEIISGHFDGEIRIWKNHEKFSRLKGHEGQILTLKSLNNSTLLSGAEDGKYILWDVKKGEQICCIQPQLPSNEFALFPVDDMRIFAAADSEIKLFNHEKVLQIPSGHTGKISSIFFTDDGQIITTSWDKTIKIRNLRCSKLELLKDLRNVFSDKQSSDDDFLEALTRFSNLPESTKSDILSEYGKCVKGVKTQVLQELETHYMRPLEGADKATAIDRYIKKISKKPSTIHHFLQKFKG